jgi:hypothetical protein
MNVTNGRLACGVGTAARPTANVPSVEFVALGATPLSLLVGLSGPLGDAVLG